MLTDASAKPNVKNNYYKIAEQKGYLVKIKNGDIWKTKETVSGFEASLVDFNNEEAV